MFSLKKMRSNPPLKREKSDGFKEGLNTLAHPSTLKNTELAEFINGIYSQYGTLSKRRGTVLVGQSAENATQIRTLQSVYKVNSQNFHFRISDNGKPEVYSFTNKTWSYFGGVVPDGYTGNSPSFDVNGVPTFNTSVKTYIKKLAGRIYFLNSVDQMCFWENGNWKVYVPIADPATKPTVAKTGSGTGSATFFYYYVWYNEVGGTTSSPLANPDTDASGQGYLANLPWKLDKDTYVTVTLPAAPAGTVKTGIFRSNTQGVGFYLTDLDPSKTTFIDNGEYEGADIYSGLPTRNDTAGQKFKFVDVYQDKLIGITVEGGDEQLQWTGAPYSSPQNAPSFSVIYGGGYIPYRLGDGTEIRGVHTFVSSNETSLLVFKDSAFGRFQFNNEGLGLIQDINIAVGSLSPESLHIAGNNFRFYSREGASSVGHEANYGNLLRYSVLSLRMDTITSQVNANNLPQVCGVYFKNLSIFGISTQIAPGNNSCLVYDERYNTWAYWTGIYANTFAKIISDVDGVERLYYGSNKSADVLEMFNGKTDYGTTGNNGEKITLSITTKQYNINLPDRFKRFDKVAFVWGALSGRNTTITVTYEDHKGVRVLPAMRVTTPSSSKIGFGQAKWGISSFGQRGDNTTTSRQSMIRYINLRQKDMFWISFNIQNDGLNDEFSLLALALYYSISNRQLGHTLRIKELA